MEEFLVKSEFGKVGCAFDEAAGVSSVALLTHGYLSNKYSRTNVELAKRLVNSGISVMLFDLYGHGKSDGSVEDFTITKARQSADAAYDFVKSRGYPKIGIFGSSISGQACLASSSRKRYDAIVLKCPVSDFKKLIDLKGGDSASLEWKKRGYIEPFGRKWSYQAYEDASRYEMGPLLSGMTAPTLIIHGDRDEIVPLSQSQALLSNLGGNGNLLIVPGADHLFSDPGHFLQMINAAHKWFTTYLI